MANVSKINPDLFKVTDVKTLKELEIGDRFYNITNPKKVFTVRGSIAFNARHGSPTRVCQLSDRLVSKSCSINVVKIGESKYKEQYKLKPINFR